MTNFQDDQNVISLKDKLPTKWFRFFIGGVIGLVLLVIALTNVYIVHENEYKVVRQFGEIVRIDQTPGLRFKIPFIQSVTSLPKAQIFYDVAEAEINTKDKKRILVNHYAIWEITNPKEMIQNARTLENAESKMDEFIFSIVRTELGQLNYDEIINDEKSSRGSLNDEVTAKVNDLLQKDSYGIRVVDVRLKRIDLPEENEQSVYKRMISERESKAQEYLSMGDAQKQRIIAQTDREVKEMLAKAQADAERIRAAGEQEAARIYNETFAKDPEFYSFYRTLESYKTTIGEDTVVILPANSPYAKWLLGQTR
ncbi:MULTISPECIES: protease modulator HflC [Anoxybacillus]|uniref:Protein HflC n=1 Tax=Anoxybacillus kestanbolensis TaxID=227476 RepID=A0A1V3FXR6_9BACL|nr:MULTISPECIES: protease modulator HflC [Anoxybacillus]NNU89672.1 protease modulator HflC [Anoxybacillus sp. CHMUD]OOE06394.1 protease modulator HflC [Anoxybacillus kestanbolensis]